MRRKFTAIDERAFTDPDWCISEDEIGMLKQNLSWPPNCPGYSPEPREPHYLRNFLLYMAIIGLFLAACLGLMVYTSQPL